VSVVFSVRSTIHADSCNRSDLQKPLYKSSETICVVKSKVICNSKNPSSFAWLFVCDRWRKYSSKNRKCEFTVRLPILSTSRRISYSTVPYSRVRKITAPCRRRDTFLHMTPFDENHETVTLFITVRFVVHGEMHIRFPGRQVYAQLTN